MRIISGKFKGRRFNPPAKNWPTRPTTDISKEGLFNILQHRIYFEECKMLDLFGGTGNHSYEFISRGCKDVTYVDKFRGCVDFVKKTTTELGIEKFIRIQNMDVFKYIKDCNQSFDYIFAGPPYPLKTLEKIPDLIFERRLLAEDGLFVLEHNPNHNFENHSFFESKRNYGTTIFSFFVNPS
jgi:16S rRNA (guanine(966)-N(2))-methyltransferase RsmD